MGKKKTRKYANPDELNMLLYLCATKGLAYASDTARKIGFQVPFGIEAEIELKKGMYQ